MLNIHCASFVDSVVNTTEKISSSPVYTIQPVVTGLTTGCIVYTNIQPVQPVWQTAVSCIPRLSNH